MVPHLASCVVWVERACWSSCMTLFQTGPHSRCGYTLEWSSLSGVLLGSRCCRVLLRTPDAATAFASTTSSLTSAGKSCKHHAHILAPLLCVIAALLLLIEWHWFQICGSRQVHTAHPHATWHCTCLLNNCFTYALTVQGGVCAHLLFQAAASSPDNRGAAKPHQVEADLHRQRAPTWV